jgi:hypothetical protein
MVDVIGFKTLGFIRLALISLSVLQNSNPCWSFVLDHAIQRRRSSWQARVPDF